jgi:hypothetical protein
VIHGLVVQRRIVRRGAGVWRIVVAPAPFRARPDTYLLLTLVSLGRAGVVMVWFVCRHLAPLRRT